MKNFEEIYSKIYSDNHQEIEAKRKKELQKHLSIVIIILTIGIIFTILISSIFFVISVIVTILVIALHPSKFKNIYKEKIITTLVNEYDHNLSFTSDSSIPRLLYNDAEFERYDLYSSNDYISGKINGTTPIELGDVHTEIESTDSDGNTTYTTIFRGLFAAVKFNQSINTTIKIRNDSKIAGKLHLNKEKMQMDSQEFEKLFDIYSQDKITAMRILTSDILDYMIQFKKENKVKFELTLKQNNLYIRIPCKDMFEGSLMKNSLDEKTLKTYYNYLDFMCNLAQKFYTIIVEKNF